MYQKLQKIDCAQTKLLTKFYIFYIIYFIITKNTTLTGVILVFLSTYGNLVEQALLP